MIISEFIEWLKIQDQGATVEVIVTEGFYYDCSVEEKEFTPELSDYTNDRRTLLLGEKN